ncbi:MAG: family 10 glycosylhydrolase [Muribaculaceae bacterium]|nr:family 10 glycosylhydrolase [Muribaculaceae bacterium]
MKKTISAAVLACSILGSNAVAAQEPPKRDFRSVWLTSYLNIDWPTRLGVTETTQKLQQQQLIQYIEAHANRNFTGVCFQIRPMADALYKSNYEPWSQYVSGKRGTDPGWDPLAFIVEECHKRGLECYAWMNPYRQNRSWADRSTPQDLEWKEKGWLINQGPVSDADKQLSTNEYVVFNPALPEVRQHILNVVKDVYMNYRVDGILFDDYFYPNNIPATTTAMDYENYKAENPNHSTDPEVLKKEMGDWRRANINLMMHMIYEQIDQDRPDMRFGLSPAGIAYHGADVYREEYNLPQPVPGTSDWQYEDIYSDPMAWLAEGSIDFISPQIYWFSMPGSNSYTTAAPYDKLCDWWSDVANKFGRHFYASLGAYRMDKDHNDQTHWADMGNQIKLTRSMTRNNAPGQIYYSAKYMDGPYCTGWGDYLQANNYQTKSLVPVVTWKEHAALQAPEVSKNENTLSWTAPAQKGNDPIMRYTVYAVPTSVSYDRAVAGKDGIAARYLLDVVYGGEYTIPQNRTTGYWYAVCAYDGYGYESEPALIGYTGEVTPGPVITTDPSVYANSEGLELTNLWYRAQSGSFDSPEFTDNGVNNRGLAIAGDKVYVTNRETATGPANLRVYDLETGERLDDIMLAAQPENYPANDIISDDKGQLYITNLVLDITKTALVINKFDDNTNTTSELVQLTAPAVASSHRVDHAAIVSNLDKENSFYVFAAISGQDIVLRWTVEDGKSVKCESVKVKALYPASAASFGTVARIFALSPERFIVTGSFTFPTEYDFATGEIVESFATAPNIAPANSVANGFVHFGPEECYMAYPSESHENNEGYKFNIVKGNAHGFTNDAKVLWTVPSMGMGKVNATTISAPVAAKTTVNGDTWEAHLAFMAPGNAIGVYKVTGGKLGGINEMPAADAVDYAVYGRTVYFSQVVDAAVYNVSGMKLAAAQNATAIELPETAGIYIVRFGSNAIRVAVR